MIRSIRKPLIGAAAAAALIIGGVGVATAATSSADDVAPVVSDTELPADNGGDTEEPAAPAGSLGSVDFGSLFGSLETPAPAPAPGADFAATGEVLDDEPDTEEPGTGEPEAPATGSLGSLDFGSLFGSADPADAPVADVAGDVEEPGDGANEPEAPAAGSLGSLDFGSLAK